ncbi:MAG: DPP IV N-terminal domain-containing protein, partial [Candidatus Cryptobacteroides sp.]|nr:DPP IV N-terminal domain-containing protein [Candidatus Cryptobacteroides sp.]
MKTQILILALAISALTAQAQDFPRAYKWLNNKEIAFSQDGSFTDADGYTITVGKKFTKIAGVNAPEKFADFPLQPEGAVNLTYSPDSTKLAFTRANNLWVVDIASGKETQLTTDGTRTVMNGYASWVYYEEILGRPSQYRAFWWSPDSQKLAFYHFDDTQVPMFPIYSPFGQDGKLRETHYPKVGEKNPDVRIGFADLQGNLTWADFNEKEDQYFGIPFWGADSRTFYVARMPRKQQTLDLYAVNAIDGDKKVIYHEEVPTWLDWMSEMLFDDKGLYMVRSFETLWQQIYFLSYDGATLKRLTDGPNWRIGLVRADKDGSVYFTAERDARVRSALYKVSAKGQITALTDPSLNVADVSFSPDGKYFLSLVSNLHTPYEIRLQETRKPAHSYTVAAFPAAQEGAQGELVSIVTDGLELPGIIYYPK